MTTPGPCAPLLAPDPLPSYAADTASRQRRPVPVLRVAHAEEEGEGSWTRGACAGAAQAPARRACTQGTCCTHMGDRGLELGTRNLAQRQLSQHTLPHPTPCADQVPPEDDEYEYSEYSVEDSQDPEAPWDSDGEDAGWAQRGSGRGRKAGPCGPGVNSRPSLTVAIPADLLPPRTPDPCSLPLDEGSCTAYTLRWYHRAAAGGTEGCHPFVYGGCGGNANRFGTREACEHRCPPQGA